MCRCSVWWLESSGELGPVWFVIHTNDLHSYVDNVVSKLADDTNVGGAVDGEEDV